MVWDVCSWCDMGPLTQLETTLTGDRYLSILPDHLHSFMSIVYSDGLGQFQQDNATPHASILVTKWLQEHSSVFRHFHWPPKSPEMNIIEDIRDALLHAVENRSPPLRTPMDLWTVLKDEWCELPPRYLQTLVESMPHRVASLLRAHGGLTRYYVPVFLALQSIKINAHEGNLFAQVSNAVIGCHVAAIPKYIQGKYLQFPIKGFNALRDHRSTEYLTAVCPLNTRLERVSASIRWPSPPPVTILVGKKSGTILVFNRH
ncbi:hypothetical protein AVEN_245508-1 [Araneus ventricosus]|uniref:Tc1-like transposase DDE domain-containing protein n=1 Tax=Araneus ventricosus TaxID=182803 RepID=A0A4Y2RZS5_ARAVE|nr:hypothetical protein AVEN_245508-1 [Araneus ventricosus]